MEKVDVAFLECFEACLPIFVELDVDAVKIVEAGIDWQIAALIVGDALIFDRLPGRDTADLVRA